MASFLQFWVWWNSAQTSKFNFAVESWVIWLPWYRYQGDAPTTINCNDCVGRPLLDINFNGDGGGDYSQKQDSEEWSMNIEKSSRSVLSSNIQSHTLIAMVHVLLTFSLRAPDNFWVQCVFTPWFLTQCWFSIFQWYFHPLYFFAMLKMGDIAVLYRSVYCSWRTLL